MDASSIHMSCENHKISNIINTNRAVKAIIILVKRFYLRHVLVRLLLCLLSTFQLHKGF